MSNNESIDQEVDHEKLNQLFESYLPKLVRLADKKISGRYKPKFDGHDIAATVCRTVYRRLKAGKFKLGDDAELWRLLVVISKRKISNKVRTENTLSRDITRQVCTDPDFQLALSREPSPEDTAEFLDVLDRLGGVLDKQTFTVFNLRLGGAKPPEIAAELGVAERTVRRKLKLIREELLKLKRAAAN